MGPVDMSPCTCTEPTGLERLRYFPRQLLTADDMRAEQEYFREKQRRHNRLLHGWGVVCGLEVVPDPKAGPLAVSVCPGYALGPFGDEIYVPEPVKLDLSYCARPPAVECSPKYAVSQPLVTSPMLVMIRYVECPTRPMRTLPAGCGCDETACEYSRTRDGFEIKCMLKPSEEASSAETVPPTICATERDKRHKLQKCPPCPTDHWVLLATIVPLREKGGGSVTLGPNSIDNSTRRIVYSSVAIQEQLILCCCK